MKKYLFFTIIAIVSFSTITIAQESSVMNTTSTTIQNKAYALAKNASNKTKLFVSTSNEQDAKCYPVFLEYYKATTQLLSAKDETGLVIPVTNESIDKLKAARNEKLQKILTPDQFKIWQSVLEPILLKDETN